MMLTRQEQSRNLASCLYHLSLSWRAKETESGPREALGGDPVTCVLIDQTNILSLPRGEES